MAFLEFSFLKSKSVYRVRKSSSWSPWPAWQLARTYVSTPGNTKATFDGKGVGRRWDCGHDTKLRGPYGD